MQGLVTDPGLIKSMQGLVTDPGLIKSMQGLVTDPGLIKSMLDQKHTGVTRSHDVKTKSW